MHRIPFPDAKQNHCINKGTRCVPYRASIEVVPFTHVHALYAANFIPATRPYGLSLGDRACLGLAKERNLSVLTANVAWIAITGIDVDIVQIR
jgi:ribonuclease VapC